MSLTAERALVDLIVRACDNIDGLIFSLSLDRDDKQEIEKLTESIRNDSQRIIEHYTQKNYVLQCEAHIIAACKSIRGIGTKVRLVLKTEKEVRSQLIPVHQQLRSIRRNLKNLITSLHVELAA